MKQFASFVLAAASRVAGTPESERRTAEDRPKTD